MNLEESYLKIFQKIRHCQSILNAMTDDLQESVHKKDSEDSTHEFLFEHLSCELQKQVIEKFGYDDIARKIVEAPSRGYLYFVDEGQIIWRR